MKALGAVGTLSVLGGPAVAQQTDGGDDGDQGDGTDGDTGETSTGAVHTVETVIRGPPTNPDRPADFFYQPTGLHVAPGDVVKFVFETPDHNVVSYHPAFGMRRRVPTGVTAFSSPLLGWRPETIPGDQIEPPSEMGGEGDGAGGAEGGGQDGTGGADGGTGERGGAPRSGSAGGGTAMPEPDTWLHAFEHPGVYDLLCSPHESFGMAMRVVVGDVTEASFETSDAEALPEPRAGPAGLARVTLTDPALEPENVVEQGSVAWGSLQAIRGGDQSGGDQPES